MIELMSAERLTHRSKYNFSAGPGALPQSVLEEASEALLNMPEYGLSVLGISHRSRWFADVVAETESILRSLMGLTDDFRIALLQGGATLQFSMIATNFLRGQERPAAYIDGGYWSQKAVAEGAREGEARVLWSGRAGGYSRLPAPAEIDSDTPFAYLHYASNETVEGLQFFAEPPVHPETPRICDMSSDFLSRPVDVGQYSMIYAHAQKNLGPAGVCICLVRDHLLDRCPDGQHSMLDYRNHLRMKSAYNTPPVFAIYVTLLVMRWLRDEIGGLEAMERINREKARRIYETFDRAPDFFRGHALRDDRSLMNISFRLPSTELEERFVAESDEAGFYGLWGHRSVGGLRVSLYNPVTLEAVDALVDFMSHFQAKNG